MQKEMKIDDLNPWYFPLPSNLCEIVPGSNHDFKSSQYRAIVSSPVVWPLNDIVLGSTTALFLISPEPDSSFQYPLMSPFIE